MKKKRILFLTAAAFLMFAAVIFDQWTKHLAVVFLKDKPAVPLIKGIFELQYLENTGAAFGIFKDRQIFFIGFTLIVLVILLVFLYRTVLMAAESGKACYSCLLWALSFLCAGAVGNLIDRMTTQYVVDFLYIKLINFPIFNVADCYVTGSIVVILLDILFFMDETALNHIISFPKKHKKEEIS